MLVITDTSPLNYLILIDAVELLPRLYQQVILPEGALRELKHPDAPPAVTLWSHALPAWIELRATPTAVQSDPVLSGFGSGEREAIALAELYRDQADVLLLLDEEAARRYAAARGLAVTGALGVLKSAAAEGWIEVAQAFARLRQTNFRVSVKLLQDLLDEDARRE